MSRPQVAQCWVGGSTQLCWRRPWGVISASFELCSEIKGVELVLVQDNYPRDQAFTVWFCTCTPPSMEGFYVTVLCCLLKYSGVVCVWPWDTLDSSFLWSVWELLPWSSRFSFYSCSSLLLGWSPFQPRGFEHWSQGKGSFGLNGQNLWAWQQLCVLRQSQFHSEFPPAKILVYANNFLRAENLLFPIGHVEQNSKLGLPCAADEEAAPLSRVQLCARSALPCHRCRKLKLPFLQGNLPPP